MVNERREKLPQPRPVRLARYCRYHTLLFTLLLDTTEVFRV